MHYHYFPVFRNVLRIFCLFLFFSAVSCQEIENEIETTYEDSYSEGDLSIASDILAQIDFTEQGVSKKQLNSLFQENYQVDFESGYDELLANPVGTAFLFDGATSNIAPNLASKVNTYRPVVYSFDPEANAALGKLSDVAIIYFKRIYAIIDPEKDDWSSKSSFINAVVNNAIKEQKTNVIANCCLSKREKDMLIVALNAYRDNISAIYDLVERELKTTPNGRFRLKRFWRRVRSIVVSTAVGAAVGFATCLCPVGALIGAGSGLIGSTLDVIINDRCHYATQCPKGWQQDCSSAECYDNPDWPPSGSGNDNGGITVDVKDRSQLVFPSRFVDEIRNEDCDKNPCCNDRGRAFSSSSTLNSELLTSAAPSTGNVCKARPAGFKLSSLNIYPFYSQSDEEFPFSLAGAVDMAEAPVSGKRSSLKLTELGYPRDYKYFWSVYTDPHKALNEENKQLIAQGKAPRVNQHWKTYMPGQSNAKIGNEIEHHHLLQGRWAIPIAKDLHREGVWYSRLHPKFRSSAAFVSSNNALARAGKTVFGRLADFRDLEDLVAQSAEKDPLAFPNQVYGYNNDGILPNPNSGRYQQGRIYYVVDQDFFLKVREINISYNSNQVHGMKYTVYDSYGYDEYLGEYFGIGVIGKREVGITMGRFGSKKEKEMLP